MSEPDFFRGAGTVLCETRVKSSAVRCCPVLLSFPWKAFVSGGVCDAGDCLLGVGVGSGRAHRTPALTHLQCGL